MQADLAFLALLQVFLRRAAQGALLVASLFTHTSSRMPLRVAPGTEANPQIIECDPQTRYQKVAWGKSVSRARAAPPQEG